MAGLIQKARVSTPPAEARRIPEVASWLPVFVYGAIYIGCSSGLIAFNKYLMSKGRFPYALAITMTQMGFSSCVTGLLFFVAPTSLFPSLHNPATKVTVSGRFILGGVLPIAAAFTVQLLCGNQAYKFASVAFLQMLKEGNVVLVYLLSLVAGLESFNSQRALVLVLITSAVVMTVQGELHFSIVGLVIQLSGQLFESSKIVLQALLLSGPGRKLDALSYVLLVAPMCFMFLGGLLASMSLLGSSPMHLHVPRPHELLAWWPVLLLNAVHAFALNMAIALFVKHSSGVTFVLAGIAKDAMIVLVGVALLHEPISWTQALGFALQLLLIWHWSMMKIFPEDFERGTLLGICRVIARARAWLAGRPSREKRYMKDVEDAAEDQPLLAEQKF